MKFRTILSYQIGRIPTSNCPTIYEIEIAQIWALGSEAWMDLNSLRTKWSSKDAAETGRIIFMAVPIGKRPDWAGAILLYCAGEDGLSDELATIVDLSYSDTKWEWISAREHFNSIRDKILAIENSVRTADIHRSLILHIGEIAAKVIYNSSGGPAPYDRESGWLSNSGSLVKLFRTFCLRRAHGCLRSRHRHRGRLAS